jgi:hypothetical protein
VSKRQVSKDGNDVPTPLTDKLIEDMLHGDGIPRCTEWDRMVAHAREQERQAHTYRAIAIAEMKP